MTDQHRATPEQWEHVQISAGMKQQIPWATADCLLELRARVEALEADQWLRQHAKPNPAWRPLDIETTYGSEAAADAAQILNPRMVVEGTFEHGGETYQFKAKPERDPAMTELRAASAEARPAGGLVERVANAIYNVPHDSAAEARAAIREVVAWLREGGDYSANAWANLLEQEADRG